MGSPHAGEAGSWGPLHRGAGDAQGAAVPVLQAAVPSPLPQAPVQEAFQGHRTGARSARGGPGHAGRERPRS